MKGWWKGGEGVMKGGEGGEGWWGGDGVVKGGEGC